MKPKDLKLLDKAGWVVECESPFEIRSKEDPESFASGEAAQTVLDYLKDQRKKNKQR